jgi:hypothetical protein
VPPTPKETEGDDDIKMFMGKCRGALLFGLGKQNFENKPFFLFSFLDHFENTHSQG